MREIKFRGKSLETGKWIYGSVSIYPNEIFIVSYGIGTKVDPNTVGQFTGLFDINKHEIYEGDILKFEKVVLISKTEGEIKETACAVVEWAHQGFILNCISDVRLRTLDIEKGEIIGNSWEKMS